MRFKRKHLAEALNIDNRGVKHFTKNKSQKVVVSEAQLTRLMSNVMETKDKDVNLPGGTNQTKNKAAAQSRDRSVQELINDKVSWNAMSKNEQLTVEGEGYTSKTWAEKINVKKDMEDIPKTPTGPEEVKEDSEGHETYHYGEDEGHDNYRLKHDDMSRSHRKNLKKDMAYDEDHEYRDEKGTNFWESKNLRTTTPITESEVKEISKFMGRMDTTGKNYNPITKSRKISDSKKVEELYEDINRTYRVIRKAIINEGTALLEIKNYQDLLVEQGQYDRNPGIAAGEGIETIIDNIKRAYSYIKDSRTRKQIMNTLAKVNNFMTYSAELIGSGSSQRAPRSYDQVANPLPYPETEDSEEELSEFHELGMFNPGDGADEESYDGHHFEDDVIGADDDDLTGKAREGEVYELADFETKRN